MPDRLRRGVRSAAVATKSALGPQERARARATIWIRLKLTLVLLCFGGEVLAIVLLMVLAAIGGGADTLARQFVDTAARRHLELVPVDVYAFAYGLLLFLLVARLVLVFVAGSLLMGLFEIAGHELPNGQLLLSGAAFLAGLVPDTALRWVAHRLRSLGAAAGIRICGPISPNPLPCRNRTQTKSRGFPTTRYRVIADALELGVRHLALPTLGAMLPTRVRTLQSRHWRETGGGEAPSR